MSPLKASAIALAGAAVGITVWLWLSEDPQPVVLPVEVVKEYVIAPPPALAEPAVASSLNAATTPSDAPLPVVAPAQPKVSELGRKLLETKDDRAFVLEALKQPEKGGALRG